MTAKSNIALKQVIAAEEERKRLAEAQFPHVEKPNFELPKVPVQVSELSDDVLMRIFVGLTRWTDHLAVEVGLASVEERSLERIVQRAESLALTKSWGGTREDKVTVAKAERMLDPEVVGWVDKLDIAYARRKLFQVMFEAAERDAALCSRELTRRVGRRESNERREHRWGGG